MLLWYFKTQLETLKLWQEYSKALGLSQVPQYEALKQNIEAALQEHTAEYEALWEFYNHDFHSAYSLVA